MNWPPEHHLATALGSVSYACRAHPDADHAQICPEARAAALAGLRKAKAAGLRNSAKPELAQMFWRAVRSIVVLVDNEASSVDLVHRIYQVVRDTIFAAAGPNLGPPGVTRTWFDKDEGKRLRLVIPSDPGPIGAELFELEHEPEAA